MILISPSKKTSEMLGDVFFFVCFNFVRYVVIGVNLLIHFSLFVRISGGGFLWFDGTHGFITDSMALKEGRKAWMTPSVA